MNRHVHRAAALHAVLGPVLTQRIHVVAEITVVLGIGIDDAADRAVLGGEFRLDAPPAPVISRKDDLALDIHAEFFKHFVIGRHAVVDIDDLARHVSVGGIGVISGKLADVGRVLVLGNRRFLQLGEVVFGLEQLETALTRGRHQPVKHFDRGVQTPCPKLLEHIRGNPLTAFAAGMVGLLRHHPDVFAHVGGFGNPANLFLERALGFRRLLAEPAQGFRRGEVLKDEQEQRGRQGRQFPHEENSTRRGARFERAVRPMAATSPSARRRWSHSAGPGASTQLFTSKYVQSGCGNTTALTLASGSIMYPSVSSMPISRGSISLNRPSWSAKSGQAAYPKL